MYRDGILEHGASRGMLAWLMQFLGHEPSAKYLLKSLNQSEMEAIL